MKTGNGLVLADINKEKKFIFLRNPKAASMSAACLLYNMKILTKNDIKLRKSHPTLKDYIDAGVVTDEELKDYHIYSFYRDPVDRFMSTFNFCKYVLFSNIMYDIGLEIPKSLREKLIDINQKHFFHRNDIWDKCDSEVEAFINENFTIDFVLNNLEKIKDKIELFRDQSEWLSDPRVCNLKYENFEEEMTKIMNNYSDKKIDITNPIYRQNTIAYKDTPTEEQKERIRKAYQNDVDKYSNG